MKKVLKITIITFSVILAIILILCVSFLTYFFVSTNNAQLDISKLDGNYCNMQIYDKKNEQIHLKNSSYVRYNEVSPYIIDTFVSVEDKRFFSHSGIDVKRMASATINNIASKSFKEGASTITQQLIKNTHLTNEKTFKRKLTEIRLAIKLEKKLSKEEIMEKYLNNLYFGSGIYGVHDACKAFFDKDASQVNLAEAAILVGVVKNPSKNSPITNIDGAKSRQKVIFSVLENNKTFDKATIENAKNSETIIKNGLIYNKLYKSFINNAIFESSTLLGISEKQLANGGYKISTYLDSELQKNMFENMNGYENDFDFVRASIDNKTMGVTSYISNLNALDINIKRQAGSLIKPFSVYLPCYENNLIFSKSQILDEKIDINGYSPGNFNNIYHGYVSVGDAVAHSYNIPAVKLLQQVGLDTSVEFLSNYGIDVPDKSKNLSLALGANSISPLKIAACYTSIANGGYFGDATFVKQIIDKNGNVVYTNKNQQIKTSESNSNFLMLDNLLDCSKIGTAKKLKDLPYQIASKTGTASNSQGNNTDAWCCGITTKNTFIAWDGAKNGNFLKSNHGGSSYPTLSIKDYCNYCYQTECPKDFEVPDSIVSLPINLALLQTEHIVQSVPTDFEGEVIIGYFSKDNLPAMTNFSVEFEVKKSFFEDTIQFKGENGKKYNIYFIEDGKKSLLQSVMCNGDLVRLIILKQNIFKNYEYFVEYEQG